MTDSIEQLILTTADDDRDAQFKIAGQYHEQGDTEKMIQWLTKAADNGHMKAKLNLALCYFFGDGVEQSYEKAFPLLKDVAATEDITARYYLSLCFLDGLGVEEDVDYAIRVLWKCAADGMDWAQFSLGECYERGRGVKQDLFEAISWYAKAAQGDVPDANDRFRQLYYENDFTDQNGEKRYFWFEEESMNDGL